MHDTSHILRKDLLNIGYRTQFLLVRSFLIWRWKITVDKLKVWLILQLVFFTPTTYSYFWIKVKRWQKHEWNPSNLWSQKYGLKPKHKHNRLPNMPCVYVLTCVLSLHPCFKDSSEINFKGFNWWAPKCTASHAEPVCSYCVKMSFGFAFNYDCSRVIRFIHESAVNIYSQEGKIR